MRNVLLALLFVVSAAGAEKLPDGTRWSPETLPDYVNVTVLSRPCNSREGRGMWMIRVTADTHDLQSENFYLLPYLWDQDTGELLVFSSNLISEAHNSVHTVEFNFHPRLLDQVVVAVSIQSEKHLIVAGDFFSGQRCS